MTGTAAGGYLLLMAVVIGYYYGVARVGADLDGYLEDLEDELARVRRELQELREPGAEARQA